MAPQGEAGTWDVGTPEQRPVSVLAAPLPTQLPTTVFGKAVEDGQLLGPHGRPRYISWLLALTWICLDQHHYSGK